VLFAGRLSLEKGILQLVEAARGMNLVVAGDGPLRDRVPIALGMLPNHELQPLYSRAAVVACSSLREGFGVACAEAMAHGRPVVASAVAGLRDLVIDGETGLLVPPPRCALRSSVCWPPAASAAVWVSRDGRTLQSTSPWKRSLAPHSPPTGALSPSWR
jgi:glycosyltransferase involved in cell wall biosynthesis